MSETTEVKKKQHYVPEMMLRGFCIPNSNRVWEYNLHSGFITKKSISEICTERYLYELRDDSGFVNSNTKNLLENEFSKIESEYTSFFNSFFEDLEGKDEYTFTDDSREKLCFWISFLIIRNPLIKKAIPIVANHLGAEVDSKFKKNYAFIYSIPEGFMWILNDLLKGKITIFRSECIDGFVTSDIPVMFFKYPIHQDCYVPVSSKYALCFTSPNTCIDNLSKVAIQGKGKKQVVNLNKLMYEGLRGFNNSMFLSGTSLIASSKISIKEAVYVEKQDRCFINNSNKEPI